MSGFYGVTAGSSHKSYGLGSVPRGRPWDDFKPKTIGRKTTSLAAQKAEARRREEEAMGNPCALPQFLPPSPSPPRGLNPYSSFVQCRWQTSAGSVGAFVPEALAPPRAKANPTRASKEASASDALGPVNAQRGELAAGLVASL